MSTGKRLRYINPSSSDGGEAPAPVAPTTATRLWPRLMIPLGLLSTVVGAIFLGMTCGSGAPAATVESLAVDSPPERCTATCTAVAWPTGGAGYVVMYGTPDTRHPIAQVASGERVIVRGYSGTEWVLVLSAGHVGFVRGAEIVEFLTE